MSGHYLGFDYGKTDSGLFIIVCYIDDDTLWYPFPINNEYLEMMNADDLYLQYIDAVKKDIQERYN